MAIELTENTTTIEQPKRKPTKIEGLLFNADKRYVRYLKERTVRNEMAFLASVRDLYANGLVQIESRQGRENGMPVPTWRIVKQLQERGRR